MNDEFKSKNGKVKVMYVRSDEKSNKRGQNPRKGRDHKAEESRRQENRRPFQRTDKHERTPVESPWRTISRPAVEESRDDYVDKSPLDPELLRRQRLEETRVYGENSCQALFLNRPESIVRGWFTEDVIPRFREALRWLAVQRKAYHVVDDAELVKVTGTEHHGGVCFLIKKRFGISVSDWLATERERDCVVALTDIGNPHNVGGIMRSCAHFGAQGILVKDAAILETGAAVRTAEGGTEHIQALNAGDLMASLDAFRKAGYTIVTTSSHKGTLLNELSLPAKVVLVLGQEGEGLPENIWKRGDIRVAIGGTGNVESLNVSVAAGILLAAWRHGSE